MKHKRLRWLALGLLGVALLAYLCVLVGLPRLLLAWALSAELGQPVTLAQNPRIALNFSRVGIGLRGLQIGKHLLQVRRIDANWSWAALRAGHWLDMGLLVDGLNLQGPWPKTVSSSSKRVAIILPQNFVLRDSAVRWPIGKYPLVISGLQANYRAGQGATVISQLAYAGQQFSLHGAYRAPQPGRPGVASLLARARDGVVDLRVEECTAPSANTLEIPHGTLRLVWKKINGNLAWTGLRYASAQHSLTIAAWHLMGQPQLEGHGNLLLQWQHAFTVSSQFQLQSKKLLNWLRLAGVALPEIKVQKVLRPAALSGALLWTQNGPVHLDHLHGVLGTTHFQGTLARIEPERPWQISAVIPRLDLNPWLPSSRPGAATQLVMPPLPKSWPPLRGKLQVGELRWGQWQARDLQIRLQAAQQ
ncbi:hypothetical protein AB4090_12375 [Acidithiobacillus sp. IBUN Pt1247-S3]|uniref:hypothetical protein n=1 Tax=Acidithiobacillus sp. IBUN Pt1247-S3 TaxID=3166642 RepID=UPI0034E37C5B